MGSSGRCLSPYHGRAPLSLERRYKGRGAPCALERFDLRRPALRDPGACPLASFAAVGRNGHQLHPAGRETRVLDHETNRCDGGSNELRMDAGSTLCALLRRSPRLDSAMEACSGAHSYGRKAHHSNLHRLSHPRSRCSHNAAPSGWAGRLPAAELPWSALSMKLGRPLVRGAQVAAARQRAGAQEDRMEVASPSPRPWRLLCCEGPLHAGLGFSA